MHGRVAELGILYAKYRPEKLMEHLKLFSTRINIPRLIRVAEEYAHWKELVFLYVQVRSNNPPSCHSMPCPSEQYAPQCLPGMLRAVACRGATRFAGVWSPTC